MKRNGLKQTLGLGTIKNVKDLRDKVNRAKQKPSEYVKILMLDKMTKIGG